MTNLQEILNSYNSQGNHDRDLLMMILSAKKAEDEVSCLLLDKICCSDVCEIVSGCHYKR